MSKIHGRATIRIDGAVYESEDDATLAPGGNKNAVKMIGANAYYNQTAIPAKVSCKVPVTAEFSLRTMQELADVEIIFESDTGASYLIRNASQTGEIELKGGDSGGTVELTFQGEPAEKVI